MRKAGIVHENVDYDPFTGELLENLLRCLGQFEIFRDDLSGDAILSY